MTDTVVTALVPTLDESTGLFPDRYTPQQVLDSESAAAGSATAASQSATSASQSVSQAQAIVAGWQSDLDTKADADLVGAANGLATLDGSGRVPPEQLPLGAVQYLGGWDASANAPALVDGTGVQGQMRIVTVAGSQTFGGEELAFLVGDWIVYDGSVWERVENSDRVTSVAGRTGAVVLTKADVGLDQVDDTADLDKPISTATQTALNDTVVSITVDGSGNPTYTTMGGGTQSAGPSLKGPATSLDVVSTTTLAAGSSATVEVTGAAPAQHLAFGIPKGDTGATGAQGVQGLPGSLATYMSLGTVSSGTLDLTGLPDGGSVDLVLGAALTGVSLPAAQAGFEQVWVAGITQDATGGRTATWPAGWKASGGLKPVLSTAPGATDKVAIIQSTAGVEIRLVSQGLA